MTRPLDDDLRELLLERASVDDREVERLRAYAASVSPRRPARRGILAAAAGIIVMLSLGGLVLVAGLQHGAGGAAPDSRLAVCGVTADEALAIFPIDHLRDYPFYLPAARPLEANGADPDAPALVIVLRERANGASSSGTATPETHDLCIVVGTGESPWTRIDVAAVDTTGMVTFIPEPVGTPIADELAPWVDRCGGPSAGILAAVLLDHGTDVSAQLGLDPLPPELATDAPAAVIVYDQGHPFPPLGTPPAPDMTIEPRDPLAPGHHDLCLLVGSDAATAERAIIEDVAVELRGGPSTSGAPSPSPAPTTTLPSQIDPADCARLRFAEDRCLAVVDAALQAHGLTLADVQGVALADAPPDTTSLGSRPIATVTWRLLDGSTGSQEVRCLLMGGQYSLVCTDRPEIPLYAPYGSGGGYHDVPCGAVPGGEPGSACATPMPAIAPDAAAAAVPLEIVAHAYPITTLGPQEILVGRATLPNGILSDARFSLADPFTRAFSVRDGISLVVRSLDPSRPPFVNIYEHGWYSGTEQVEVYLVLDVTTLTPGARIEVRDLVVR